MSPTESVLWTRALYITLLLTMVLCLGGLIAVYFWMVKMQIDQMKEEKERKERNRARRLKNLEKGREKRKIESLAEDDGR